ncbi:MAG: hypothetical protein ACOC2W_03820 [bacterium]
MEYILKENNSKVELGDQITINGVKLKFTTEIYEANTHLFHVIEYKYNIHSWVFCRKTNDIGVIFSRDKIDNMIEVYHVEIIFGEVLGTHQFNVNEIQSATSQQIRKAIELKYPKGSVVKSLDKFAKNLCYVDSFWHIDSNQNIWILGLNGLNNAIVYSSGQWAKIMQPLFKTYDGVDIYNGEYYYFVNLRSMLCSSKIIAREDNDACNGKKRDNKIYFSTEQAAKKWIDSKINEKYKIKKKFIQYKNYSIKIIY